MNKECKFTKCQRCDNYWHKCHEFEGILDSDNIDEACPQIYCLYCQSCQECLCCSCNKPDCGWCNDTEE